MESLRNYRIYYAVLLSILLIYFIVGNLVINFKFIDMIYLVFILLTVVRILNLKIK